MDDLEQKLLLYGDLSPEEQAEVERCISGDPGRTSLLAESRTLHTLLSEARAGQGDVPDATEVAEYVLSSQLDPLERSPAADARDARVEAALRERPELERQARQMLRTLERLAAEAEDPVAQFERLTGRRLADVPAASPTRTAPDRPALRLVRLRRIALAAGLALAALYGGLLLASRVAQPERALLADLGAAPDSYAGLNVRGAAGTVDHRYARALDRLARARRSTLGLFPSYDEAELDDAAQGLGAVADAAPGSWEGLEALYVLGRVRLHQGRDEEAALALRRVVEEQGPSAPEARRLLDWLQASGSAPP